MVERTTGRCCVVKMAMVCCQLGLKTTIFSIKWKKIVTYLTGFARIPGLFGLNLVYIASSLFILELFGVISTYAVKICFVLERTNALV